MSELSTANASASASGLLAGLRSSPPSGYGAGSNSTGVNGDTPNFSSVLKDRADKLPKPEGVPAESRKPQDARESAAQTNEAASAAAEAASDSERLARTEKKNASSSDKKSDDVSEKEAATDEVDNTPIAAVMAQMTPAALIASNADTIESGVIADAKSPFGAMVRELARGHGQGDKNDAGNQGLALAVGQGDGAAEGLPGKAGANPSTLADAGPATGQSVVGDPSALMASVESEMTPGVTNAGDVPELPAITSAASDEEVALASSTTGAKGSAGSSDFNQLLTQARDGQSSGLSVNHGGRTGGSEAALAMRSPVGHPNWSNELGDKMTWMVTSQRQQADLVLNPPQLGRIEVSLTVNGDQASAVFTSPNAAVREMLENSLPRLREIMAGSGLNLGQADVGAQSFAQQQGQDGQRHAGAMRGDLGAEIDSAISAGGTLNLGRPGERRGMVDLFA